MLCLQSQTETAHHSIIWVKKRTTHPHHAIVELVTSHTNPAVAHDTEVTLYFFPGATKSDLFNLFEIVLVISAGRPGGNMREDDFGCSPSVKRHEPTSLVADAVYGRAAGFLVYADHLIAVEAAQQNGRGHRALASHLLHCRFRRSDQRVLKPNLAIQLNDSRPKNVPPRRDRDDEPSTGQGFEQPISGARGNLQTARSILYRPFRRFVSEAQKIASSLSVALIWNVSLHEQFALPKQGQFKKLIMPSARRPLKAMTAKSAFSLSSGMLGPYPNDS